MFLPVIGVCMRVCRSVKHTWHDNSKRWRRPRIKGGLLRSTPDHLCNPPTYKDGTFYFFLDSEENKYHVDRRKIVPATHFWHLERLKIKSSMRKLQNGAALTI